MSEWYKSGCVLCAINCGLRLRVEDNRIVEVRPDRDNPRSRGYICRKGLSVMHHQHHAERLTHPLKRVDGRLKETTWTQALEEIAAKLKDIVQRHGPRSVAYMGGGGQGCHFEAAFGVRLLRGLGSRYHYNALGQELTGLFWVDGRAHGRQYKHTIPDLAGAEMLVGIGWNGMMSHQVPRARKVLKEFSRDPDRLLVIIDPRPSETARIADLHLPLRPGSDALLTKAMIAIILDQSWQDQAYLEAHVSGWDQVAPWFEGFDARAAVEVCGLELDQVQHLCRLMTTRRWCLHPDLGVFMSRHSTTTSYLHHILMAVCGRLCVPGGNVIPGHLMPICSHSDERDPRTWRTVATDYPAIAGVFPPNVMPEEILCDHPERLRAVIVSQSNPLRSYADTAAFEEAFGRLELLVTCELAMTETAAASHYVLPARSAYESWDGTFFALTFPELYFQMRGPVVMPRGIPLEVSQILTLLADHLGLVPEIPESLHQASQGDRLAFGMALMPWVRSQPGAQAVLPFILARTLGREFGSANLAALWGLLMSAPPEFQQAAARMGYEPGPAMGEKIFTDILAHPEGLVIGRMDPDDNFAALATDDGRINLCAPEMAEPVAVLQPPAEQAALAPDPEFPLVLGAGSHMDYNANTLMRNPAWNQGRRACTCAMHPDDADELGLADGQVVRVVTEAGEERVELEVSPAVRPGTVIIPHGFGLAYQGEVYGINVNRLTKNTHRDPLAGTPLHRYVPCRVEAA